jgi:uncharacterized small protein (TIGR04563 family)
MAEDEKRSATILKAKEAEDSAETGDRRKQSLYFPQTMLVEIKEQAVRLDRSLSWVVQRAWKVSKLEIRKMPSSNAVGAPPDDWADKG